LVFFSGCSLGHRAFVSRRTAHQAAPPDTLLRQASLWSRLRTALEGDKEKGIPPLGLPALTWYQATRHTFASQWVIGGGSLEELRDVMGHSTVLVTERYAHLRPGKENRDRVRVDLSTPAGAVVSLRPQRRDTKPDNGTSLGPGPKSETA